MKDTINSYIAVLLIAIAGAIASLLIIRVAYDNAFANFGGSEAAYSSLEQSILAQ